MYESHFQFQARPFPYAPRTDLYFPAASIEHAHQTLARLVERAEGPGLLIGGPGTGKSLVCQMLAERFRDAFHVVVLTSAQLNTRRALLQHILFKLGLTYRGMDEGELRLSLIEFLESDLSPRKGVLLLVDEAHALPLRLFEDLRMISNLAQNGQPRVRVVLSGSPQLEERFAQPELESFNQRLAARCYLQPLNYDETCAYVHSQIAKAGASPDRILAPDAWQAIYHATDGIARLINQVCDHALMLACTAQRGSVDGHLIQEAWADLQQLPTPWQPSVKASSAQASVVEFGELDNDEAGDGAIDDIGTIVASDADDVQEPLSPELEASFDLPDRLDELERQPDEVDEPAPVSAVFDAPPPQVADAAARPAAVEDSRCPASASPFDERFEQEEVVIDRYASLQATHRGDTPTILKQREIALAMQTIFEQVPAQASPPPPIASEPAGQVPDVDETAPTFDQIEVESHEAESEPPIEAIGDPEPREQAPVEDIEERVLQTLSELDLGLAEQSADSADETIPGSLQAIEDDSCIPLALNQQADQASRVQVVRSLPPDDNDMIIVVDEDHGAKPLRSSGGISHRQEYRQLFSRLRQS